MRALVTGGTGFVGSAVVRELLKEGFDVVCLVRLTSDLRNLLGLDVALAQGDLDDIASLRAAARGCQHLYHLAAYYSISAGDATRMFHTNVEGTRNVLTAAAEAGLVRIVHTSTIGTIGRPATTSGPAGARLPTEEDVFDEWETASPYVRSKLEAERLALELAHQGAPIVVVDPCAPVGARDIKPSSTGKRLIDYLSGRWPSFPPGGINFIAVEDVARGHLLAAQRGRIGERYILGNADGNLVLKDFCALMESVSGVRPPGRRTGRLGGARTWPGATALRGIASRELHNLLGHDSTASQPARGGYLPHALTADPTRAICELGLPQSPLDAAFHQAIDWFRANGYVPAGQPRR